VLWRRLEARAERAGSSATALTDWLSSSSRSRPGDSPTNRQEGKHRELPARWAGETHRLRAPECATADCLQQLASIGIGRTPAGDLIADAIGAFARKRTETLVNKPNGRMLWPRFRLLAAYLCEQAVQYCAKGCVKSVIEASALVDGATASFCGSSSRRPNFNS
jgi:hypothetical protein